MTRSHECAACRNQLEKVQNGTTAYLKAQELLLSANNKLRQLEVK